MIQNHSGPENINMLDLKGTHDLRGYKRYTCHGSKTISIPLCFGRFLKTDIEKYVERLPSFSGDAKLSFNCFSTLLGVHRVTKILIRSTSCRQVSYGGHAFQSHPHRHIPQRPAYRTLQVCFAVCAFYSTRHAVNFQGRSRFKIDIQMYEENSKLLWTS